MDILGALCSWDFVYMAFCARGISCTGHSEHERIGSSLKNARGCLPVGCQCVVYGAFIEMCQQVGCSCVFYGLDMCKQVGSS